MNAETIQNLVDGTLTASERADAIRQIEEQPDHWRIVALELLHRQQLERAVHQYVAEELSNRPQSPPAMPKKTSGLVSTRDSIRWHRLAMAAAVLLMIGAGYWLGQKSGARAAMNGRVLTASLESNESDLSLVDALAKCVTPVPDSFRRELLMAGYFLAEDQRLTQVALPTGGTVEMPVRHFNIHYIGNSAFQ